MSYVVREAEAVVNCDAEIFDSSYVFKLGVIQGVSHWWDLSCISRDSDLFTL